VSSRLFQLPEAWAAVRRPEARESVGGDGEVFQPSRDERRKEQVEAFARGTAEDFEHLQLMLNLNPTAQRMHILSAPSVLDARRPPPAYLEGSGIAEARSAKVGGGSLPKDVQ
jgi:hypothetical protein